MKRAHLIITGRVQGVFFRHNTKKAAQGLGLKGHVRNLSDGNVEIIAEGEDKNVLELINFCKSSPGQSCVDKVNIKYEKSIGEFYDFDIKN